MRRLQAAEKAERNAHILKLHAEGLTNSVIAIRLGSTAEMVGRVIREAGRQCNQRPKPLSRAEMVAGLARAGTPVGNFLGGCVLRRGVR